MHILFSTKVRFSFSASLYGLKLVKYLPMPGYGSLTLLEMARNQTLSAELFHWLIFTLSTVSDEYSDIFRNRPKYLKPVIL